MRNSKQEVRNSKAEERSEGHDNVTKHRENALGAMCATKKRKRRNLWAVMLFNPHPEHMRSRAPAVFPCAISAGTRRELRRRFHGNSSGTAGEQDGKCWRETTFFSIKSQFQIIPIMCVQKVYNDRFLTFHNKIQMIENKTCL